LPNRAEKNWAVLPGPSSYPARSPPQPSYLGWLTFIPRYLPTKIGQVVSLPGLH
jgi:hypothetical protein